MRRLQPSHGRRAEYKERQIQSRIAGCKWASISSKRSLWTGCARQQPASEENDQDAIVHMQHIE
jgi:hypothetical protein